MTFAQLRTAVGTALQAALEDQGLDEVGLYHYALPSTHERLVVRFWFPLLGAGGRSYDGPALERPTLQVDVKHFPPPGSVATPDGLEAESVWEALKWDRFPGFGGCTRLPAARPPVEDPADHALWGFHQYRLTP